MTRRQPAGDASELAVPSEQDRRLLARAYAAYNRQDLDALLALVSDDIEWPDGPRTLHGRAQVRTYWGDQWSRTRTHDEPVTYAKQADGRTAVTIDQVVYALDGAVLSRGHFLHLHRLDAGRITAMRLLRLG